MNLNACLRQARDELLDSYEPTTPAAIVERALEINGARTELEERAVEKAIAQLRREARRMLDEVTEAEIDTLRDPDGRLFAQLPGLSAPRAVALSGEDPGDYVFKAYGATTDADLEANDLVLTENIDRAVTKREDRRIKRKALQPYRDEATTTIEALRRMANAEDAAS